MPVIVCVCVYKYIYTHTHSETNLALCSHVKEDKLMHIKYGMATFQFQAGYSLLMTI